MPYHFHCWQSAGPCFALVAQEGEKNKYSASVLRALHLTMALIPAELEHWLSKSVALTIHIAGF